MFPLSRNFSRDVGVDDGEGGARLHRVPPSPSDVKINVKGAFIVDDDTACSDAKNGTAGEGVSYDNQDIRLPYHTAVVSHVAVDVCLFLPEAQYNCLQKQIGGSLAKVVYFSREPNSAQEGGRLNFLNFETDRIDLWIDFLQELKQKQLRLNGSSPGQLCVIATGGGAYKFYDRMKEVLGIEIIREDEMECLIIGESTLMFLS